MHYGPQCTFSRETYTIPFRRYARGAAFRRTTLHVETFEYFVRRKSYTGIMQFRCINWRYIPTTLHVDDTFVIRASRAAVVLRLAPDKLSATLYYPLKF